MKDNARTLIVQAANRDIVRRSQLRSPFIPPRLLSQRQIQQAVCIVRRRRLVKPDLLTAAGFRAAER